MINSIFQSRRYEEYKHISYPKFDKVKVKTSFKLIILKLCLTVFCISNKYTRTLSICILLTCISFTTHVESVSRRRKKLHVHIHNYHECKVNIFVLSFNKTKITFRRGSFLFS